MQLLANDTAGLMDALKIPKADVMGYSLGSIISQAFTISHPEKVSRLILVASTCGGKEGIPKPAEFLKLQTDIVNKGLNHTFCCFIWTELDENASESGQIPEQLRPGLSPEVAKDQSKVADAWTATNWSGACDELAKIAKPTLVIAGTDDNDYAPHGNSLKIAEKIPGAWLAQIKNAGNADGARSERFNLIKGLRTLYSTKESFASSNRIRYQV
jgi:pimeloyl-ACP methyl ester carboxylesterase